MQKFIQIGLGMIAVGVALVVHAQEAGTQTYYVSDLGTLESTASVNGSPGQVVGESQTAGVGVDALLSSGGVMQVSDAQGGENSRAFEVDDNGQIIGFSRAVMTNRNGSLYSGMMQELSTLQDASSQTTGINNRLQAIAYSDLAVNAFLDSAGPMQSIGTLADPSIIVYGTNNNPQNISSQANGINANGPAADYYSDVDALGYHAALDIGGVMVELNSLLPVSPDWTPDDQTVVSGSGQLAGDGEDPNGNVDARLLTPFPGLSKRTAVGAVSGVGLLGYLVVSLFGQLRRKQPQFNLATTRWPGPAEGAISRRG